MKMEKIGWQELAWLIRDHRAENWGKDCEIHIKGYFVECVKCKKMLGELESFMDIE